LAYVETPFLLDCHWVSDFLDIVGLSISVSLMATATATAVSLPIGAALAVFFLSRATIYCRFDQRFFSDYRPLSSASPYTSRSRAPVR
jgi:hypothetical protein